MKLNLEITPDYINLFDANTNKIFNQIPINDLGRTVIKNGKTLSYWIELYFDNIFIRKYHIYQLAKFIHQNFPNNTINWFEQFYRLEFYQKMLDTQYFQTDNSEMFNRELFNIDEDYFYACAKELAADDEQIAIIKGIVLSNLVNHGLL